ncbi:zinc transporter ZIP9-like [Scyliorhinus canicula]|uniref:zinc transporter ZIP9-like n=1 Tax=Scyliorhinus canicula TaxID=7830 RepID=UPI0018F5032F|nr:zinc transporter ZIP9-like [Scyliorhinus canicula]
MADRHRNMSQSQVVAEIQMSDGKQAGTKQFVPPHFIIGISLVMGFLLMFIVDQIGNCIAWDGGASQNPGQPTSDGQQSSSSQHPVSVTQSVASTSTEPRTGPGAGSSITATLGLVIHAAADGVALGTAAASSQISLQVIVFLAVILHKVIRQAKL